MSRDNPDRQKLADELAEVEREAQRNGWVVVRPVQVMVGEAPGRHVAHQVNEQEGRIVAARERLREFDERAAAAKEVESAKFRVRGSRAVVDAAQQVVADLEASGQPASARVARRRLEDLEAAHEGTIAQLAYLLRGASKHELRRHLSEVGVEA